MGVPEISPDEFIDRPDPVNVPAEMLQLKVPFPPVAVSCKRYGTPTNADGSGEVVWIAGPALTVRENAVGPVEPEALLALTLMFETPAAFGVPLSTPVLELKAAQDGKDVADHVIGVSPAAAKGNEYAVPMLAPGSGLVDVIVGAVVTEMLNVLLLVTPKLSVAVAVKL